ncbi:endonuclease V [Aquincola sp. S2]|uniref:Endonuclease V n=1 Tax=Pseudaquabacterium terrae TaxID=2732868 RepID=A0ABX2EGS7_9BURK|nr:endonuclease V [Aquabacterium terrae]NRF67792.1 endonuclease V [Aquabacterium terrae]
MKLAVGVHDHGDGAWAAAVAFDEWDALEPVRTYLSRIATVEKPARGELDLRALPCLLQLLREHALEPDVIVIDGAVHLDAADTPGLGRRLYDALGGRTTIIGVSTKSMPGLPAQFEVFREEEARPVIVTCVGLDLGAAKARIRAMHGKRRVPTLLKLVARMARGGGA